MTGFASLTRDDESMTVGVTVRAVNHRFLDLQLRIPPSLATFESRLRSLVQQRVARGRVEISVTLQQRRVPALEVELNEAFLDALGDALERARARGVIAGPLTPGDLLRFPQALAIRERVDGEPGQDEQAAVAAARGRGGRRSSSGSGRDADARGSVSAYRPRRAARIVGNAIRARRGCGRGRPRRLADPAGGTRA